MIMANEVKRASIAAIMAAHHLIFPLSGRCICCKLPEVLMMLVYVSLSGAWR